MQAEDEQHEEFEAEEQSLVVQIEEQVLKAGELSLDDYAEDDDEQMVWV